MVSHLNGASHVEVSLKPMLIAHEIVRHVKNHQLCRFDAVFSTNSFESTYLAEGLVTPSVSAFKLLDVLVNCPIVLAQ